MDRQAIASSRSLCLSSSPAILAAELFWSTGIPTEIATSATSARTKTTPAAQAYRSHARGAPLATTAPSYGREHLPRPRRQHLHRRLHRRGRRGGGIPAR